MPALAHAGVYVHDKKTSAGPYEAKILDEVQGIVEAIVSVTAVLDDVGDIIEPGAYANTLKARPPKGVWSHDWDVPVAKTLEAVELMPGDPRLPVKIQALGGGGLWVKMQFNLGTQRGRDAFSDVVFYEDNSEWSIGYTVPPDGAETDQKTGVRYIKDIDLFEYSPVLFGANAHTATISAKAVKDGKARTSDAPWDGPGQKALFLADAGAKSFRRVYAWVNPDGDPEQKTAYKFLHHFAQADHPASVKACFTGIKMLNGSGGGTTIPVADRKGVYEHLVGHLRDAGIEDIPALKSDDEMKKMMAELEDFLVDVEQGVDVSNWTEDELVKLHAWAKALTDESYETLTEKKQFCADCGTKFEDWDHKAGCPPCGHGFEIKLGDAKAFCNCEKTVNHPGPHGFADKEGDMGAKAAKTDEVVEEVTVSKAPNEPVTVMVEDPVDGSEEVAKELVDETAKAENDAKDEWIAALKDCSSPEERKAVLDAFEAELENTHKQHPDVPPTPAPPAPTNPEPAPTTPPPTAEAKLTAAEKEILDVLRQIGDLAGNVVEKLGSAWQESDEKSEEEDDEKATPPASDPSSTKPHAFKDDGDGKCKVCGKSDGAQIHNTTPGQGDGKGTDPDFPHEFQGGDSDCSLCGKDHEANIHVDAHKEAEVAEETEATEEDEEKNTTDPDEPHPFRAGSSPGREGVCQLCGRNAEANMHQLPKAAEETDNKINVALQGSFEDTQVRVAQALDGAIAASAEGAQTATFVEATFGDSVLVCAIDFLEGEPDEEGYASIQMLGQRYLSVPYSVAEGVISLGEATEVEVSGVLTPKAAGEAVSVKTITAIENKVGRTLSAANAEKIRNAVQSLIEVLGAAGIDVSKPVEDEDLKTWVLFSNGKISPFGSVNAKEAEAEVKAEEKVSVSLIELLQGEALKLHA